MHIEPSDPPASEPDAGKMIQLCIKNASHRGKGLAGASILKNVTNADKPIVHYPLIGMTCDFST